MKRSIFVVIIGLFLIWNAFTLFLFLRTPIIETLKEDYTRDLNQMKEMVEELREKASRQAVINDHVIESARLFLEAAKARTSIEQIDSAAGSHPRVTIPVLVMACDRVTVKNIIDSLLSLRPSHDFPVVVSQDCKHDKTREVIQAFGDRITFIEQPDQSDFSLPHKQRHLKGYFKISRHYKWALGQVFNILNYSAVIIVEDDLNISPDFFEYFRATYDIMATDSTLWCVSAWNDNGKEQFIDPSRPDLLYRTDFFPGLGWMLFKDVWQELEPKWPISYWDDWMRHPSQRKGRSCIRPEISRTSTFGKIGVSKGQYYEKHLKYIRHYTGHVPFTHLNLSYLVKDAYDKSFLKTVYSAPLLSYNDFEFPDDVGHKIFRVEYKTLTEFVVIAKKISIMDDLKSDIPRTGYMGIVSTMHKDRRVFIAPPAGVFMISTPTKT